MCSEPWFRSVELVLDYPGGKREFSTCECNHFLAWECVLPVITGWVSGKIVMTQGDDPNSQLPRTCTPSWDVSQSV